VCVCVCVCVCGCVCVCVCTRTRKTASNFHFDMNVMSLMSTLDGLVDELGLQHVLCQCIRSGG
jgi:hypothetical protein